MKTMMLQNKEKALLSFAELKRLNNGYIENELHSFDSNFDFLNKNELRIMNKNINEEIEKIQLEELKILNEIINKKSIN